MIVDAKDFKFEMPPQAISARKILIKPDSVRDVLDTLLEVIKAIKEKSEADIFIIGEGEGIEERRVHFLDIRDFSPVEIENPLQKPFAISTFWVPNILLSCDFLITISSLKVLNGEPELTLPNLLPLLPEAKYKGEFIGPEKLCEKYGKDNVIADLYFTIPFDIGIVDGRKKIIKNSSKPKTEKVGKIFVGNPVEVDKEASSSLKGEPKYIRLIERVSYDLHDR